MNRRSFLRRASVAAVVAPAALLVGTAEADDQMTFKSQSLGFGPIDYASRVATAIELYQRGWISRADVRAGLGLPDE